MYIGLPHFNNCFQYMYKGSSQEAIFIFHGFPSQKNRNKDIAFALSQTTNHSIIVHHYEGLGESLGEFSFMRSIETAEKIVSYHLNLGNYSRIHFIGHSWGGFIALNLLRKFADNVNSILLLSPFSQIPQGKNLKILVEDLFKEYPHCFYNTNKLKVLNDFQSVSKKYNLITFIKALNITQNIQIFQAKNDLSVPEETTKALKALLGKNCKYTEYKVDHSFTQKRKSIINKICRFF